MEEVKSMGSTLTLLFVEDHEFFVLNVGDSRTYWFDKNRKFVTTDHTLVELELRAGHLTKEQARKDPRRHILLQCVGVTKDVRVDCYKGRLHPVGFTIPIVPRFPFGMISFPTHASAT